MTATTRPFPRHFLFGAATAAFQVEGAAAEDGRRPSIWDAFCRTPGAVAGGDTGDVACDHYHRYRQDVALMRELGLDTYRFSVSWARVRPDAAALNPAGVDFYRRLVDELLDADIVPWLTLYHWDMPQALQERGGWTNRESSDRFTEFALDMHDALGDRVAIWTTLNEPWCSSFLSYTAGVHAPGQRSIAAGLLASHHLLLGHGQVIRELRSRDASLSLGLTLNLTVADAADPDDPADADAARRIDGQFNRWFLDPVFRGAYPQDAIADISAVDPRAVEEFEAAVHDGDLAVIATPIDTLGVNYYHGELLSGREPEVTLPRPEAPVSIETASPFPSHAKIHWVDRDLPRTNMGWDVQPEGLTRLLARVSDEYTAERGIGLYVTENGASFDDHPVRQDGVMRVHDADRTAYLYAHLEAMLDAIDQGVDLRGFFYWSLMDNFEWAWGYAKRFGLVYVDYATQQRVIKDSGYAYADIIASRQLSGDGIDGATRAAAG
jgi:beta-glucosidase